MPGAVAANSVDFVYQTAVSTVGFLAARSNFGAHLSAANSQPARRVGQSASRCLSQRWHCAADLAQRPPNHVAHLPLLLQIR